MDAQWFWAKVERRGDDECWPCLQVHKASGYGQLRYKRQQYKAHRVAYALTFGQIEWGTGKKGAQGLLVLHRCDNRRCCNPKHLFLGTQKDNMLDCSQKQRIQHGVTGNNTKLTLEQVAEIKRMQAAGRIGKPGRGWSREVRSGEQMSLATVGKMFGVSGKTIEQLLRRRAWKDAGEPN